MAQSVLFCTGFRPRIAATAVLVVLGVVAPLRFLSRSAAAEPELVGVLALAAEEATGKELALSQRQRGELLDLIDKREREALPQVLALKDLSPDVRREKLAPFRRESEQRGLALLDDKQRAILSALHLKREGLAALIEPDVAKGLSISAPQQTRIAELLRERDVALRSADAKTAGDVRQRFESELSAVLDETQRTKWQELTRTPALAQAASAVNAPAPPGDKTKTADQKPTAEATAADRAAPDRIGNDRGNGGRPGPGSSFGRRRGPGAPNPLADGGGQPSSESTAVEKTADGKLRFNFRFQPWAEVIQWFAKQADLSLVMDSPPPGTFNYTDTREYTPAEAIDLLNSVLLTKGYTLVRRERMLMVINLEDGIPPNLVPAVALKDLDSKGEFEVISVLFSLHRISPDDAEAEIGKLLGPQGSIVKLPKARQIQITETGGRLRRIRGVLEAIEGPQNALAGAADAPQLEVYSISSADPQSVFDVLQTLLSGLPDVRLAIEPKSGNLVAFARPAQHATIRATIDQMQRNARKIEVIHLRRVDPQLAVLAINKLFGGDAKEGNATAPKVDAEPTSRQLLVRGSDAQIAQIRQLLNQMGEVTTTEASDAKSNVRMIPLKGRSAQMALEAAEQLWPTLRKNKVRIVSPSSVAPAMREAAPPSIDRGAPASQLRPGDAVRPEVQRDVAPAASRPRPPAAARQRVSCRNHPKRRPQPTP